MFSALNFPYKDYKDLVRKTGFDKFHVIKHLEFLLILNMKAFQEDSLPWSINVLVKHHLEIK